MRNIKSLVTGFAFVIMAIGLTSCTKDSEKIADQSSTVLNWRSDMPSASVINGMLHFDTYEDFRYTINYLKSQENDTSIVKASYQLLGINLENEPTENITDFPVCRLFENDFIGYVSMRRYEEDIINDSLNCGADMFSFIIDPYFKSVVNTDNCVHIGTRIFKFYVNGGVAIILNNNWIEYDSIKNMQYEDLHSNESLFITNWDVKNWYPVYDLDENNAILNEKDFDYPDIEALPGCDIAKYVTFVQLENGDLRFELNVITTFVIQWVFSDGTILIGNPVIKPCTSSGSASVYLRVFDQWGWLICVSTESISYECGNCVLLRGRNDRTLISTVHGETWRIEASIWVRRGEVGTGMKYLRRGFLGGWYPASNDAVRTEVSGKYFRTKDCVVKTGYKYYSLGKGTYPTSISATIPEIPDIGKIPELLSSKHGVNVNGTWFGFGYNGVPSLVLY